MQTGWFLDEKDGSWYYLQKTNDGSQGKMQTGWIKEGEAWYYLGPTGRMTKGWNWIDGKCYYMDQKNGHMLADCVTPDGYTCLLYTSRSIMAKPLECVRKIMRR